MTLIERNDVLLPQPVAPPISHHGFSSAPADPLSFGSLLAVLGRRYRLFLAVLAAAIIVSGLAAFVLPPQYSAEARLMIDPRPHGSAVVKDERGIAAPDATLVDTEVELITSPTVLRSVVERLHLVQDPEFAAPAKSKRAIDVVTGKLAKHLNVTREGLTYIVSIRARSRDGVKAVNIANTLADEYLRQSKAQRANQAAEQAKSLLAELGPLGQQVVAADQAVANYRAAHRIVSTGAARADGTGGGAGNTVTDQEIATIAAELGRASADAAAARAAAAAAEAQVRGAGVDAISQVLSSPSMTELRNQRAQVLREQAQIATIYGPDHPASVRINSQLARLDKEIRAAADHVVGGLQNDARASTQREDTLRGRLAELEARQMQDAQAGVVADGLQRDADAKRSTFNDLSRNAQEQAQEARIGDVRAWLVSGANRPLTPSFPKKSIFLMIGFVMGTGLGAASVAAAEFAENGFRSGEEVAAELRAPLLAAVPELTDVQPRRLIWRRRQTSTCWDYVLAKPVSSFAESIRNVRAALLGSGHEAGPQAVCVTSAVMGEGKSVIAVALARVMAMSGDRVLLIDCDLRRSGLAPLRQQASGASGSTGLLEVLHGESDPHSAIVQDVVPGLSLLGLEAPVFTSRDVFSGQAARELIARLKSEYDFIILDAPPVLAVTDAWTISSICDATLLVVRHAKTARAAVRAAADRLRLRGSRPGGVVLNRRPPTRGGEGGYYAMHAAYFND